MALIIATVTSWRFLGERLSLKSWLLIGTAFAEPIPIMIGQSIGLGNMGFVGILLALIAAFFYALIPNPRRFLRGIEGKTLTFLQLAMTSAVLAPFMVVSGVGEPVWWMILVLVRVHTVLALVNEAALLSYLDPMSAMVYAFLVSGEVLGARTALGEALISLASLLDIKARGS